MNERIEQLDLAIENKSDVEFVEAVPAGNCCCAPCAACSCCCVFEEIV
jgi:hypothetical protein